VNMRTVCLALWLGGALAQAADPTPKEVQAREMEILRRTLAEQQSNPGKIVRTPQTLGLSTNASIVAARQELEQQFIDGKITAKQFQRGIEQLQQEDRRRASAAAVKAADAKVAAKTTTAPSAASGTPAPAAAASNAGRRTTNAPVAGSVAPAAPAASAATEATPEQKKLSEVEARLEEMERQKAAREKAALTNPAPANTPAMTKRQKLDALLKDMIEGKISEADYNGKRAKLIAEPD